MNNKERMREVLLDMNNKVYFGYYLTYNDSNEKFAIKRPGIEEGFYEGELDDLIYPEKASHTILVVGPLLGDYINSKSRKWVNVEDPNDVVEISRVSSYVIFFKNKEGEDRNLTIDQFLLRYDNNDSEEVTVY